MTLAFDQLNFDMDYLLIKDYSLPTILTILRFCIISCKKNLRLWLICVKQYVSHYSKPAYVEY